MSAALATVPTAAGAPPSVRVDPALAETAVRLVLDDRSAPEELVALHRSRIDGIYDLEAAARDRAFAALALAEFAELELAAPVTRAVAERPDLAARVRTLLMGEPAGRREEGITCEPGGVHLGVRVDPARFVEPESLLAWARHALGHAEDTLDPRFAFEPGWEEGAAGRVPASVQARLHRLWDVTVDARLAASGHLDAGHVRARHRAALAGDLPAVDEPVIDAILERLWAGDRPAFPRLLAWATRPTDLVREIAPGTRLPRPDRCPLCRFPGDDVAVPDPDLAAAVARDFPAWTPDDGLCGRCADRYRFSGSLGGEG